MPRRRRTSTISETVQNATSNANNQLAEVYSALQNRLQAAALQAAQRAARKFEVAKDWLEISAIELQERVMGTPARTNAWDQFNEDWRRNSVALEPTTPDVSQTSDRNSVNGTDEFTGAPATTPRPVLFRGVSFSRTSTVAEFDPQTGKICSTTERRLSR